MDLYYPELCDTEVNFPSRQFQNDAIAIMYFQAQFGNKLMAVVKDTDPKIEVIWDAQKVYA